MEELCLPLALREPSSVRDERKAMELPKSSCVISSRRLCPSLGHGRVLRHLGLFLALRHGHALRHGRALLHWHAKLCIARLVSVSVQKSSYVGHFGVSAHPPVKADVPCNLGQIAWGSLEGTQSTAAPRSPAIQGFILPRSTYPSPCGPRL